MRVPCSSYGASYMTRKVFAILGSLVLLMFVAYMHLPMPEGIAEKRARQEISWIWTDQGYSCQNISNKISYEEHNAWIFGWSIEDNPSPILFVRVPKQRLGDLTFGKLGEDVRVWETEKLPPSCFEMLLRD